MITDDILKDISEALSKKIKKDFTKYKEYSILFFACDVHVRFARVAQWWSTSLPRRGSRVRSPSRAFIFLEVSNGYLFCYFVPATCIEPARVRCLACRLGRCFCFAEVSTGHQQPVSLFG